MKRWRAISVLALICILAQCIGCTANQNTKAQLRELLHEEPDLVFSILKEHDQELLQTVQQAQANQQVYTARVKMLSEAAQPIEIAVPASTPHEGPLEAPNTLILYSDFLCPYCKLGDMAIDEYIAGTGRDNVLYVPKFMGSDQTSYFLALCYEALTLQADIDPTMPQSFRKQIFANQDKLRQHPEIIDTIINDLGADIDRLNQDIKSAELNNRMQTTIEESQNLGLTATPSYIINGITYVGYLTPSQIGNIASMPQRYADQGKEGVTPLIEQLYPLAESQSAPQSQ